MDGPGRVYKSPGLGQSQPFSIVQTNYCLSHICFCEENQQLQRYLFTRKGFEPSSRDFVPHPRKLCCGLLKFSVKQNKTNLFGRASVVCTKLQFS